MTMIEHDHEHAPVAPGPVVLDIGEGVGAAVITADHSLQGREIEIRAAGTQWDGRHVAFHERQTAAGSVTAAVFPHLEEGDWEVRLRFVEGATTVPFHAVGGQVTTVRLPT